MTINSNSIYGGSLIVSRLLAKDYSSMGIDIAYFISFQEFDKYVRYISYGIPLGSIVDEICNDIASINSHYAHTSIPGNIKRWITANFSYAYGLMSEDDSDE